MDSNSLPQSSDKLTEDYFISEIRALLVRIDNALAGGIMQQMTDEISKRPTQDHKLTTMARYLILLQKEAR